MPASTSSKTSVRRDATSSDRQVFSASAMREISPPDATFSRSEEHTSELQSPCNLGCRLLLEKRQMRKGERRNPSGRPLSWHSRRVACLYPGSGLRHSRQSSLVAIWLLGLFFHSDADTGKNDSINKPGAHIC